QQAFRLGVAAFRSSNPSLAWPLEPPQGLGSSFAVHRTQRDISGGDALAADARIFATVAATESARGALYWQKQAQGGARPVGADPPFNWQGDWYSVFLLDAAVSPAALRAQLAQARSDKLAFEPIIGNRWTPPLVLADEVSGALWFIDFGEFD